MKLRGWGQRGLAEQDLRQVVWLDSCSAISRQGLHLWLTACHSGGPSVVMNQTLEQDVLLFTSISL